MRALLVARPAVLRSLRQRRAAFRVLPHQLIQAQARQRVQVVLLYLHVPVLLPVFHAVVPLCRVTLLPQVLLCRLRKRFRQPVLSLPRSRIHFQFQLLPPSPSANQRQCPLRARVQ